MSQQDYFGIVKDICPKCKKLAERVGVYSGEQGFLKDKIGWSCSCGFKKLAPYPKERTRKLQFGKD